MWRWRLKQNIIHKVLSKGKSLTTCLPPAYFPLYSLAQRFTEHSKLERMTQHDTAATTTHLETPIQLPVYRECLSPVYRTKGSLISQLSCSLSLPRICWPVACLNHGLYPSWPQRQSPAAGAHAHSHDHGIAPADLLHLSHAEHVHRELHLLSAMSQCWFLGWLVLYMCNNVCGYHAEAYIMYTLEYMHGMFTF